MPKDGHLSWTAVYQPGYIEARGFNAQGRRIKTERIETTGAPERMVVSADRTSLSADNQDVSIVTIELQDRRGRFVPDACEEIELEVAGPVRILGVGNGDPAYLGADHPKELDCKAFRIPAFNGLAQVLVQSSRTASALQLECNSAGLQSGNVVIQCK
jgi:beta-galactosidase